ncbi:ribosomal RNA small subunit methyltransferase E [Spirochaetia bacterium]|nr:ribosomal RNA small subunit methyltransferase E [Spirochaetia bacterium]
MKRFILSRPPDSDGFIRLSGRDYHYLVRVRRLKAGALFPALLPNGAEVQIQVHSTDGDTLVGECLTVDQRCQAPTGPFSAKGCLAPIPPILLFQALPKGTKMDLIVRQAAEGGITEIVPFASEHSIPKIQGGGGEKLDRWERIVREARQQSGSGIATALHAPLDMDGLLAYWESIKTERPGSRGLLFHQDPVDEGSLHGYLEVMPELTAMAIGPEGGFSPAEVSRFLAAGFKPVKIGDTILRTETAALYGAAAIRIILLESASWTYRPQQKIQ